MESTYTIYDFILAFWLSGVVMAFWQLYMPSMKVIKILEPNNLVVRYYWLCSIAFIALSFLCLPFLVAVLLDDERKQRFMKGFIPALPGKEE